MEQELNMLKASGLTFKSIKSFFEALHSGAKAKHLEYGIERSKGLIDAYKNNKGMGWRVDRANKSININTPKLNQNQAHFDSYLEGLSPARQTAARAGRQVLATAYDIPKMLTMHPNSITGMVPSIGFYTGTAAAGINLDPYSRAGQAVGLAGAKPIATEYGTAGGQQALTDFQSGFDNLGYKDRRTLASNPDQISQAIDPSVRNSLNKNTNPGIRFSSLLKGTPDLFDDTIRSQIANTVKHTQL